MLAVALVGFVAQSAAAQDFTKIPPGRLYQVGVFAGYPILEDGDVGCAMVADQFNQKGTWATQWLEYTAPEFQIRPSLGQGCKYIVISHGGFGGYPEGYSWENFRQNDVVIKPSCPVGYTWTTQHYADGTSANFCARAAFVASKPCPVCSADPRVGNPISSATGRKIEHVVDASFGSLALSRTFRSGAHWDGLTLTSEFGVGWYSQISARIQYTPEVLPSKAVAYAVRPDGTVLPFLTQDNVSWTADKDLIGHELVEVRDASGIRTGWTLTTPDGMTEKYDAKGVLLSLSRRGVIQVELQWDAAGRLKAMLDQSGRKATVITNSGGRIERIALPDGAEMTYTYDAKNRLLSVTSAGQAKKYEYIDISGKSGAYLSKILDENDSAYAEFTYETSGNAIRTQHAGGVDSISLTYRNGGNDVDVLFPAGRTETYHFVPQFGSRKLQTSALTCSGCATLTDSHSYDANGYPDLEADRRGITTDRDFNAQGLEVRRVEAINQANKRTIETNWNLQLRVPTERRTYDAADALVQKEMWSYNSRGQMVAHSTVDL